MSEERKSSVDRIQQLLDAPMTAEEREQGVAALTPEERSEYEALAWLKQRTGQALGGVEAPQGLEDRIRSDLSAALRGESPTRLESGQEGDASQPGAERRAAVPGGESPFADVATSRPSWGILASAIAALLVLVSVVIWQLAGNDRSDPGPITENEDPALGQQDGANPVAEDPEADSPNQVIEPKPTDPPLFASLVEAVADDVEAYRDGALSLDFSSQDSVDIQNYFAENGIPFHTRVFDLAMMEYQLAGGTTHTLEGKTSAAFAYHGPNGIRMLCQMYEGTLEDLPEAEDVREHNGIKFYSFQRGSVAMTFWREGDVICVLASLADLDEVVALAFAKAEKV